MLQQNLVSAMRNRADRAEISDHVAFTGWQLKYEAQEALVEEMAGLMRAVANDERHPFDMVEWLDERQLAMPG